MAQPPRPQKFRQDRAIVDPRTGNPTTEFLRNINNGLDLLNYLASIQAAADAANAAAVAANTAADNAQAAADTAQGSADSAANATALANSYVTGITITAEDAGASATINISAHTRVYASDPPVSVSVNAGSVTGLAYSTQYYIYYDQASRAGGAVTYLATTSQNTVAQINNRHSVGSVMTPAAASPPNNGGGVKPPGTNYNEP